jgi:dipeptidyl aminopeptidase/acylaminoacyl peptidase
MADVDDRNSGMFGDLDAYIRLPRLDGLWLSPDGRRLVVGVATPAADLRRYVPALWELDPDGRRPARRLTHSDEGETGAGFTPSGDLLFVSKRQQPDVPGLWRQPAGGGDAEVLARLPGGVRGVVAESGTLLLGSALLPDSTTLADDEARRAARKAAGVTAVPHERYPIRYWDRELGPDRTRLFTGTLDTKLELRDLTGDVGWALDVDCVWDLAPDGRTAVAVWTVDEPGGAERRTLVAIDLSTGERRTLADDPDHQYGAPKVSPDGTRVAVVVQRRATPHDPGDRWLGVVPIAGGAVHALTGSWDRWPHAATWTPDGGALVVPADDGGRTPLWRVDARTGEVTRLTPDDGAYTDVRVAPDGRSAYALRSAIDHPPHPVRVALDGSGDVSALPGPAEPVLVAGPLTEVSTTAADGTPLRGWLSLPPGASAASPVPLLLWIHGGPLRSWSGWSWRWNPWLAVARGYAVLQPDPAPSTGYGVDFVARAWGGWGGVPYSDVLALTDAALARPDLDATRTAAMGASFGGYLANWIATHTDRFTAIVTHASLWALDQLTATTDRADEFLRMMTPDVASANSPHHLADRVSTPMLVIHGDKDYRVPVSEALRLWWDLSSRSTVEHQLLLFPDEGHWITGPGNVKAWYEAVFAFLDRHLR